MLIRSRSARLAVLALAAATPLVASYASPAFAVPGNAVVSATVANGIVHVTSTQGLSRTTIVYCAGDPLTKVIPFWEGDVTEGDIPVTGVVRAVFVHSGNNTTSAAQDLLTLLAGAGAVHGNSTGAVALDDPDACDDTSTNNDDDDDTVIDDGDDDDTTIIDDTGGRDDNGDGDNSDPVITIASDPAPVTSVLGVTIEKPADPAPALAPTVADGSNLEVAGGELPRTGTGHLQFLSGLGLALLAAGAALKGATSRRIRSASFPG